MFRVSSKGRWCVYSVPTRGFKRGGKRAGYTWAKVSRPILGLEGQHCLFWFLVGILVFLMAPSRHEGSVQSRLVRWTAIRQVDFLWKRQPASPASLARNRLLGRREPYLFGIPSPFQRGQGGTVECRALFLAVDVEKWG